MKYATIFLVLVVLAFACTPDQLPPMGGGEAEFASYNAPPKVVEVVMFDESGTIQVGVAMVPIRLAYEYSQIEFYEGISPGPGVDFDIIPIPMKGGGEAYMLCIK